MKQILILCIFTLIPAISILNTLKAQSLAINTDGSVAHSSAILDIKSITKGVLSPRMTTVQRTAIAAPAAGLSVYDTDTNSFWYYGGTAWINLAVVGPTTSWLLTGNAATVPGFNFIGTTDNQPLQFRVNSKLSGNIDLNGNVSFGLQAAQDTRPGAKNNTAIGSYALLNNTLSSNNTAIGSGALYNQSFLNNGVPWETGNVAIGYHAMIANNPTSSGNGIYNTAIGSEAMLQNTIGNGNTAVGYKALYSNFDAFANTAIGYNSLYSNKSGNTNTGIGYLALSSNTTGNENTATGYKAMSSNTTGEFNSAYGYYALSDHTNGNKNTAIGYFALGNSRSGQENTATGYFALLRNSGLYNTATGSQTLVYNTFGVANTATGDESLYSNLDGSANTASGWKALYTNTVGEDNTANGGQALYLNVDGNANTANGYQSLYNNSNGRGNTAMGWNALTNNTFGSENTSIGYFSNAAFVGLANATAIGARATVNSSNKMQLGNTNTLLISTSGGYAITSDGRFKENLKTDVKGLDFIMKLRPVTYNFNYTSYDQFIQPDDIEPGNDTNRLKENPATLKKITDGKKEYQQQLTNRSSKRETGFVAQEVEKAVKESGYAAFNGVYAPTNAKDNYSLDYSKMVVPLVKAMQEQQQMIDELKKINQDFLRRLEALEKKNH